MHVVCAVHVHIRILYVRNLVWPCSLVFLVYIVMQLLYVGSLDISVNLILPMI